jgi:hypothetical protein
MQDACVVQNPKVMRNSRAGERRGLDDLSHIEALTPIKQQQHALAVLIAEGGEDLGHWLPFERKQAGVVLFHDYIISHLITPTQPDFVCGRSSFDERPQMAKTAI